MEPDLSQPMMPQAQPTDTRRVGWGPLAAVLVTVSVYFVSQILGGVVVYLYPVLKHWTSSQAEAWVTSSVYAQFGFVLIVESLTLWLIFAFIRHRRTALSAIGLKRFRLVDIGYALSGFAAYFASYIILVSVLQRYIPQLNSDQKQELGFSTNTTGIALVVVFVSLVLLPPIVEEIVARGFLYTGLRKKMRMIPAAIITSILFGAAHLQFGSGNALLWSAAADTFILSMVLVYLREKTGSLWASICLHMIKNSIAFVGLFILHLN